MLKLSASLLLAASLAATTASAQTTFRFGVRAGANLATHTLPQYDPNPAYSSEGKNSLLLGGQAGVAFEANFGRLALQPALLFSQKGTKSSGSTTILSGATTPYNYFSGQGTRRTNWLELPLNVVYTPKSGHGLQLFAGPYAAVAVGGRQTTSGFQTSDSGAPRQDFSGDYAIEYGGNTNNRRFDWGVNFGVGYRMGPVQVQAGYGLGLRSLYTSTNNKVYNRGAQLTATYFWGK